MSQIAQVHKVILFDYWWSGWLKTTASKNPYQTASTEPVKKHQNLYKPNLPTTDPWNTLSGWCSLQYKGLSEQLEKNWATQDDLQSESNWQAGKRQYHEKVCFYLSSLTLASLQNPESEHKSISTKGSGAVICVLHTSILKLNMFYSLKQH